MADRGEQRGAQARGVRPPRGVVGLGGHPPVPQGEQCLPAHGGEQRTFGRGERPAAGHQVHALVDLDVGIGVLGPSTGRLSRARRDLPRPTGAPLEQGHRGEPERLPDPLEEPGQRIGAGEHDACEGGQQRRLGAGLRRLDRAPVGAVHDEGHEEADEHHRHDLDRVLRLGHGQRVQRRGEEEVQQQPTQHRGEQGGTDTAHERGDHGGEEEDDDVARQPDPFP